ncbi:MAG: hypothetical protein ACOH1Q_11165 [Thiobacillus sp.]
MNKVTDLHQSPRLFDLYADNRELFEAAIYMAIEEAASNIGYANFAGALCAEHHSKQEEIAA